MFHNNKYFINDKIKKAQIRFNEALDDLFYEQGLFEREKKVTFLNKDIVLSDVKSLYINETFEMRMSDKDNIIRNNFYSSDENLLEKLSNTVKESNSAICKIDKKSQCIAITIKYEQITLFDIFKDVKILTDYFRLLIGNFTLCSNEILFIVENYDSEFRILYDTPLLEVKKYKVDVYKFLEYRCRNKLFYDNFHLPLKLFFEKYKGLENCIFTLNENHYSEIFTSLYLSRAIDCLASIAIHEGFKSDKYKNIFNCYFASYPNIIKLIDKIVENISCDMKKKIKIWQKI